MKDRGRMFLDELRALTDKHYKEINEEKLQEQEKRRLERIEASKKVIPNIIESIKKCASRGEYSYTYYCNHKDVEIEYITKELREEYCIPIIKYQESTWPDRDQDSLFIYWGISIKSDKKENSIKQWFSNMWFSIYCYFH